ncbi:MAG: DNA starvation/stationary phase protection protein [Alphaproteobacteria bacterium CG_4_9_14_3_um_filter_47_13]|nr:MAG: DNA starvation/stationary phase protection protein [Alphaproteobacteria bacterium CG_4_9_14_3_um_filter_47_13]
MTNVKNMDIGLGAKNRKHVAQALKIFLADTYTLYLKTQNYHWNVKGKLFQPLHQEFEKQYRELAEAVDTIAEQIRALGLSAPGSYKSFAQMTSIDEADDSNVIKAEEMINQLTQDNETVIKNAGNALKIAQDAEDEGSADLLIERIRSHEKTAWMLRSFTA